MRPLRLRSAVPLGIGLLVAVWLQQGMAGEPPVEVGEVTTQAGEGADIDPASLRTMVSQAVRTLDGAQLPRNSRAVLSVSLVRMNAHVDHSAAVTCAISATLRDRSNGNLFAVLEGTASGEDEPHRLRALEHATARAAVGSAIARVPEAMRKRRR